MRKFIRRLLMLLPGYRKAHFVELEVQELRRELVGLFEENESRVKAAIAAARPTDRTDEVLQAIAAARPADRTDELKAIADWNLCQYHEHLNNAQAELKGFVDNLFKDNIRCRWQVLDALDGLLFPPSTSIKCIVCGHEAPKSTYETRVSECVFGGGRLERFVCPECGCVFGPLKMMALGDSQLANEYSQHYHVYSEGDSKWKEIAAFHALNPQKSGRYLNFGAGAWSKSTIELRAEGWDVYDYEPYAPEDANEWVLRSYDQLRAIKFDGIFSNDVLEHFKDPVSALRDMIEVLKPGGRMAHCTGCYEYAYDFTRFHYVFFTGTAVERLASAVGLKAQLGERLKIDEPARICLFSK